MGKKEFLTAKFYDNELATLEVFNKALKRKHLKDNYDSGVFIFLEIDDNDENRELLSGLICDFDAYIKYNQSVFETTDNMLELAGLQMQYDMHFGDSRIAFNKNKEEYFLQQF